jgi:glycosyltransferase involved in cell wall biosynthesis
MRPNRLVKKTFQQRYVSAIVAFFRDHKIQLDPTKDIFYSQWLPDAAMVQQAAHLLGVKSAVIGIGDDVIVWPKSSDANFKTFEKLYTEADLRIFNADYLGREANEQLGKAMPYETVYFGVDHSAFRPATAGRAAELKKEYHIPAGKVAILIVGTALKRKGWIDLFDALAAVKKVNSGFILVGGHAGSQDLVPADEAAKRGLTAEFLDLGEIRPQDLGKLYNAADIFCLPSHWEGLPTVVIEAMSSGLPVITTNVCGQPEVVSNNGVNGILVTPKDIPALTEALLTLIADAGKRAYLGHNAREFIVNEWGNYTQNAAKLYRKFEALLSR